MLLQLPHSFVLFQMVRNYVKKKGIQPKYSEDKLRRGIDEVKSHTMTVHKTSVIYRIQSRVHEVLLKNVKDEQLRFLKMLKTFWQLL
jgi:transcriptional regulator NrdR family protein